MKLIFLAKVDQLFRLCKVSHFTINWIYYLNLILHGMFSQLQKKRRHPRRILVHARVVLIRQFLFK